jgi:hypothetical protein
VILHTIQYIQGGTRTTLPSSVHAQARVMIYGHSAGAGSMAFHLASPRSRGLFSRVGIHSGPVAPSHGPLQSYSRGPALVFSRDQ